MRRGRQQPSSPDFPALARSISSAYQNQYTTEMKREVSPGPSARTVVRVGISANTINEAIRDTRIRWSNTANQAVFFRQLQANERTGLLRNFVVNNNDLQIRISTGRINQEFVHGSKTLWV